MLNARNHRARIVINHLDDAGSLVRVAPLWLNHVPAIGRVLEFAV